MKIGVISDTHGFLDPRVEIIFSGVQHILHAGDIGEAMIELELKAIAPVTVVLGNTDLGLPYRLTEIFATAEKKFLVQHIVNPVSPDEKLQARLMRDKPDAVIFGHTHKKYAETIGDILFFNPGYAGKFRPGSERSVAILHVEDGQIRYDFIPL
ncbi:MAG TPA: metallophosphoesterase family protein [Candidatus Sulfotelmatobacter sp.]|jgi:putative phosphoesterase|nr:metallophosphoesterase family protein [Candidatus Sulfotelmatobacter sp.]